MRELLDIVDPRDRIDLDVPLADLDADRLVDVLQRIDAISDRIEDAIFARLPDATIEEADVGPSGISPKTAAQRSQRDARRRDQLSQLSKKQNAVRASMGT